MSHPEGNHQGSDRRHGRRGRTGILSTILVCALALTSGACGDSDEGTAAGDGSAAGGTDLVAGEQTYMDFCGSCHGRDFEGSAAGPSQLDPVFAADVTTDEDFRRAITEGAPKENYDFTAMPAIGSLDDTEIENVIAYVRSVQEERGFND